MKAAIAVSAGALIFLVVLVAIALAVLFITEVIKNISRNLTVIEHEKALRDRIKEELNDGNNIL